MSWRDRPYAGGDDFQPELRLRFRPPSSAVTWLIVINVVVYVVELVVERWSYGLSDVFGLCLAGITALHFWQPLTYMFLHASPWHLLINMLMLYVCGTEFERRFGPQRLLKFYATCGIVGGLAYLGLGALHPALFDRPLVGASGAVYGLLIAAIILFPHIQVVLFIFPMPIRVFGAIVAAILLIQLLSPGGVPNPGGEVCHIAGAATGMAIFYAWGVMPRIRLGSGGGSIFSFGRRCAPRLGTTDQGEWARRQRKLDDEQAEVDRILAKVHREGLQSLSRAERNTLSRATKRQRDREHEFDRVDRL